MKEMTRKYEGRWATKPRSVKEGILFSLYAPGAGDIFLSGDFNGWKKRATPLVRGNDNVWRAVLKLKPGRWYDYKFIVDDRWINDPNNPDLNPDTAGGANSVIYLGSGGEILPQNHPERHKFTLEGRGIRQGSYFSHRYGRNFEFHYVYPEHKKGEKLPVLICLNNYIKSQEIHMYARKNGYLAVIPSVDIGPEYIRRGRPGVFPELLNALNEMFALDEDRVAVTGMSNGALEAFLVSLYYPDLIAASTFVFGPYKLSYLKDKVKGMGRGDLEKFITGLGFPHRMLTNLKNLPLYISHGGGDEAVPADEGDTLFEIMKKLGAPAEYKYYPEYGHTWHMVDEDLPNVFGWIKRFKRNPFPPDIHYVIPHGYSKGEIFWIKFFPVEIGEPLTIKAQVDKGNIIKLKLQNIEKVKLYLSSELLHLPGTVYIKTDKRTHRFEVNERTQEVELTLSRDLNF